MAFPPGTRIGVYEVSAKLGEGGMGEVYRARDSKLNRDVAIKVLLPEVAGDAERLARFRREAQVLAALNHPNIAHIHGIEDAGPIVGLVLELVEGPTLADRIRSGPLPLDEALAIASQIADALEAAHEQGIVHRDLKPANIKVRPDGTVKVLDFGLAKAIELGSGRGPGPELANSPTITSPAVTARGMILGTAAYMSPEQAKGHAVDHRADIWAFGVVLYEMLTGRRAFRGDDASDLLVSVLRDTPDYSVLPAGTPASVRRLLRRCLEKHSKKRLSAIGDARFELDESESAEPLATAPDRTPRRAAVFAVGALVVAALAAATAWYLKPLPSLPVRLLELPAAIAATDDVALSPDGTRLAYFLDGHLYVRTLDALTARDLGAMPATAGRPFWSPDSQSIGFWAESEIRTIPSGGGPVFAVCKIPATGLAIATRWRSDNTIVFAVWRESVYSVPAGGGTPTIAVAIDQSKEIDVHHLSEAPGGRLIAMIHQLTGDRMISVLVDKTGARAIVTEDQTISPVDYVAPGYLVFERIQTNAGLWAAPFDGGPIDPAKATLIQAGARSADVARDGSMIFQLPAASKASPVWIDRAGVASTIAGAPVPVFDEDFALAPDGRRVAIVLSGIEVSRFEESTLIARNLETGVDTQLTFKTPNGPAAFSVPRWFASGDRILLTTGSVGAFRLMAQKADEAAPWREFAPGLTRGRVTRDGRLLVAIDDDRGRFRLMSATVSADGVVATPRRVFRDDDPEVDTFDLSPDGRLVVYAQRLTDRRHNIFLTELPDGANRRPVAEAAGWPRFSADGREIFYLKDGVDSRGQRTATLMSQAVNRQPAVSLGAPAALFTGASAAAMNQRGYDVAPDGRRFLAMQPVAPGPGEGRRLIWMQNWLAAIRK